MEKLQNSLHDYHATFRSVNKKQIYTLGFVAAYEKNNFYVSRFLNEDTDNEISLGDYIVEIDSVPTKKWKSYAMYASPANNLNLLAQDYAARLSNRPEYLVPENKISKVKFKSRVTGKTYLKNMDWEKRVFKNPGPPSSCADTADIDYGNGYQKIIDGIQFCIYSSDNENFKHYPILRFISFLYPEHDWESDRQKLKDFFNDNQPKGFIIDLTDNGGGMDPNFFKEWFRDNPYKDNLIKMRLDARLATPNAFANFNYAPKYMQKWYEEQLVKNPGKRLSGLRPFFDKNESYDWDNIYYPADPVTRLPFAILSTGRCISSCDAFAQHFTSFENIPLIGEPPAAAYTSFRYIIDVKNPADNTSLGKFTLAISEDYDGNTLKPLEGFLIKPARKISKTFDNSSNYHKILTEAAIKELASPPNARGI